VFAIALRGIPVGYGSAFGITIISMLTSSTLYLFWMAILLSFRLRQYDLKLFVADPANSELISRLSKELGSLVYIIALIGTINVLTTTVTGKILSVLSTAQVLLLWLPLFVIFILNQTSLSSIIRRAKWKTLNEAQAKIETLQASKNFEDKETMDSINRLMDYHDRVKATRDSALDFRTYVSFINSLLLPLLAFILGNLDLVLNLFARKP
jgi:hypothetical protein